MTFCFLPTIPHQLLTAYTYELQKILFLLLLPLLPLPLLPLLPRTYTYINVKNEVDKKWL